MGNREDRALTINDRWFFVDFLSKIRLLPRRRFVRPRLGNGFSNGNINLCGWRNVIFSVDFRQVLAFRRMCCPGVLPGYPVLAFYSPIPQAPSSNPRDQGRGRGAHTGEFPFRDCGAGSGCCVERGGALDGCLSRGMCFVPDFRNRVPVVVSHVFGERVFLCLRSCVSYSTNGPLDRTWAEKFLVLPESE